MTSITRKVCIVGDFAVGKTSLVERFVNNHFSQKYLTTIGVKVDTKEIFRAATNIHFKLVLWDVAGAAGFGQRELSYCRGAAGIIYVIDGTRPSTVASVLALRRQLARVYGHLPNVLLINKADLGGAWQVAKSTEQSLAKRFEYVFRTSAKRGDDVELAMTTLADSLIAKDL